MRTLSSTEAAGVSRVASTAREYRTGGACTGGHSDRAQYSTDSWGQRSVCSVRTRGAPTCLHDLGWAGSRLRGSRASRSAFVFAGHFAVELGTTRERWLRLAKNLTMPRPARLRELPVSFEAILRAYRYNSSGFTILRSTGVRLRRKGFCCAHGSNNGMGLIILDPWLCPSWEGH
jgi:hypothetical protein